MPAGPGTPICEMRRYDTQAELGDPFEDHQAEFGDRFGDRSVRGTAVIRSVIVYTGPVRHHMSSEIY